MESNTPLGQQAQKLYTALTELGEGWHSRPEIASHLGKTRLNTAEVAGLDLLVEQRLVVAERRDVPPPSAIPTRWEYKVIG